MSRLAILAGAGHLPVALAQAHSDAFLVAFAGMATDVTPDLVVRFEHLGTLFQRLQDEGITRVVMAGGMSRPVFDPTALDDVMQQLAPRLMQAMAGGDDGLLRTVIAVFEEQGLKVVGAHTLLPDLTATEGLVAGNPPTDAQLSDIQRADAILGTLSPVDVGQAVVVEGGVCLGIETVQGTDALLGFVGDTPNHLRRGQGVLVKRPKIGQDLRVDMPAIGPATVEGAAQAGLAGIVISPSTVLVLDRPALVAKAEETGLFILARRHV